MKLTLSVPAAVQKSFKDSLDRGLYDSATSTPGSALYRANWPENKFDKFTDAFEDEKQNNPVFDDPMSYYAYASETFKIEFEIDERNLQQVLNFWQGAMYSFYTFREKYAQAKGRRERFEESTDLEQFIVLCRNLRGYDLEKVAEENEFILQDIQYELPKAIENLNEVLERAKALEPIAGAVTPFKLKESQSILFRFDRKYRRGEKNLVIGTLSEIVDVNQKGFIPISLNYTMIYAYERFEKGKLYTITNLGIHKPRRSHPGYNTFKIELVDESEIC